MPHRRSSVPRIGRIPSSGLSVRDQKNARVADAARRRRLTWLNPGLSRARDLVYTLRDFLDDPDYVREVMGPEVTLDTLLAAINAAIARESRLKTPGELIDRYLLAPNVELAHLAPDLGRRLERTSRELKKFRQGRRPRPVAWQAPVRELCKEIPPGPGRAMQVWKGLGKMAGGDHDVIREVVMTNDHSSCRDVGGGRCANGPHLHYWNPGSDRLLTVSRKRIQNFISRLSAK
jgi:hypothetical protein